MIGALRAGLCRRGPAQLAVYFFTYLYVTVTNTVVSTNCKNRGCFVRPVVMRYAPCFRLQVPLVQASVWV